AATPQSNTVAGTVPAPNPGASVVVVLEPRTERSFPPQTETPVMDQVGLSFGPDVLFARTGQPVEFRNNDDTLHNVHVTHEETREASFNVAILTGEIYRHTFAGDGFYRFGCDIHPAMGGMIFDVVATFNATAGLDGAFIITD